MDFVYELLRAGTSKDNVDSGADVARKFNDNFKNVKDKFSELENEIKNAGSLKIPIGTEDLIGGVKSSDSENKVSIHEDGDMEVNSLNIKKLAQDDGDFIIIDGNI